MSSSLFHLAIPVNNLNDSKDFYVNFLGCTLGRSEEGWIDVNFFGHQITMYERPEAVFLTPHYQDKRERYPIAHFGAVLPWDRWHSMKSELENDGIDFLLEPHLIFAEKAGEQKSFFIQDPSGYPLEFKTFERPEALFATETLARDFINENGLG